MREAHDCSRYCDGGTRRWATLALKLEARAVAALLRSSLPALRAAQTSNQRQLLRAQSEHHHHLLVAFVCLSRHIHYCTMALAAYVRVDESEAREISEPRE